MDQYRVLVVDDNREVRRMVTASIKTLDMEIDVLDVPSAEEALFINSSLPLDLVVVDIRLPGMSGLEMVTKLRKRKPETKIILITGVEDAEIRQQITEAGAEAYFFKPIEISTFLDAIKRSLGFTSGQSSLPSNDKDQAITTPSINVELREVPAVNAVEEPARGIPSPTITERLTDLKQKVKAVSVILVNDAGQILEEAGSAIEIRTGSALLSALMHAFQASLQLSQAMAKGTCESLQYIAAPRQCIYVAPVGLHHALFVVTAGYFGPDKLGMIYHTIHLSVHDLQIILAKEAAEQKASKHLQTELPAEVTVDQETLEGVENMFAKASKTSGMEKADGFWETVGDNDALDGAQDKGVLSYDQARDMGLAPDEDKHT